MMKNDENGEESNLGSENLQVPAVSSGKRALILNLR
jgi:hypothetical protein